MRHLARPGLGAAALVCGVTRLAEITGLDCIGVPVFQAVRPLSRALCVHQGKGLTAVEAMTGALMEAIESHQAEMFDAPRRTAPFHALPETERAPSVLDFAATDCGAPGEDEPIDWVEARRLADGGRLWVPFEVVSLDFTYRGNVRLDRSSNGLGAGYGLGQALSKALLEIIERDAHRAWRDQPMHRRSLDRLDEESVPFGWFHDLGSRLAAAGRRLSIYLQPTPAKLPVILAEMIAPDTPPGVRGSTYGVACHPDPETALLGAVLEALQSRAAEIAGARDDIPLPSGRGEPARAIGFGFPLPPGIAARPWPSVAAAFAEPAEVATPRRLRGRLAGCGYADAAMVDLSPPGGEVFVVKAVVPGLGGPRRSRRPPPAAR